MAKRKILVFIDPVKKITEINNIEVLLDDKIGGSIASIHRPQKNKYFIATTRRDRIPEVIKDEGRVPEDDEDLFDMLSEVKTWEKEIPIKNDDEESILSAAKKAIDYSIDWMETPPNADGLDICYTTQKKSMFKDIMQFTTKREFPKDCKRSLRSLFK